MSRSNSPTRQNNPAPNIDQVEDSQNHSEQQISLFSINNLLRLISFPIQTCYFNFVRLVSFTWSLFGFDSSRGSTTPLENVNTFIQEYEKNYGSRHPTFYRGSYGDALQEAKKDLKFLLVYLHNNMHEETAPFCSQILAHKEVISYISRNNILFWACSLELAEGYKTSMAMRENTYPFIGLVVLKNGHMTIVRKFEGPTTVERFLSQLQQSIEDNEASIVNSRREREERDMNQQLRRQQDEDYLASLRADQMKDQKRREEKERKQREEQEKELERLRKIEKDEQLLKLRADFANQLPNEPNKQTKGAINLRVKLPHGRQIQRIFLTNQSMKYLFDFVFAQQDCPKNFKLKTNFPVRELPCTHPTLEVPESRCTKNPNDEPITFETFGIVSDETLYLYDLDA